VCQKKAARGLSAQAVEQRLERACRPWIDHEPLDFEGADDPFAAEVPDIDRTAQTEDLAECETASPVRCGPRWPATQAL
jgi:hypothetical protein